MVMGGVSEEFMLDSIQRFHNLKVTPNFDSLKLELENQRQASINQEMSFNEKLKTQEKNFQEMIKELVEQQGVKLADTIQLYERQVRALMRVQRESLEQMDDIQRKFGRERSDLITQF